MGKPYFDPVLGDLREKDGGNSTMGEEITTNYAVGNLGKGTVIHASDTVASVVKRMVLGYIAASASCKGGQYAESGTTATGTITFSGTAGSAGIASVVLKIGSVIVATAKGTSGSYTYSVTAPTTFTCVVTEVGGTERTATATVSFVDKTYYGVCNDGNFPTNSDAIRRLTSSSSNEIEVNYNDTDLYICYPASKTISSILTANGEQLKDYTVSTDYKLRMEDGTQKDYKIWHLQNKGILNVKTTIKFV